LAKATLLMATDEGPPAGVHEGQVHQSTPGQTVSVRTGQRDGRTVGHAFTDEAALLLMFPGGTRWIAMLGDAIVKIAVAENWDSLFVNARGPIGMEVIRPELQRIAEGLPTLRDDGIVQIEKATRMLVGMPAKVPSGLREAAVDVLRGHPAVGEAFLYQIAIGAGEPHLALAFTIDDPSDAAMRTVCAAVGAAVRPFLGDGYVDMLRTIPGQPPSRSSIYKR
jgi:hypothetical protein